MTDLGRANAIAALVAAAAVAGWVAWWLARTDNAGDEPSDVADRNGDLIPRGRVVSIGSC